MFMAWNAFPLVYIVFRLNCILGVKCVSWLFNNGYDTSTEQALTHCRPFKEKSTYFIPETVYITQYFNYLQCACAIVREINLL
jgi:hypothetical protein